MSTMHPGVLWMIAGLALLGAEILCPGVFMMWLGIAAILAGIIVWQLDWAFAAQVSVFAALAVVALAIGIKLRPTAKPTLNTQIAGLAGRQATALSFSGREGRVRLGDSDWSARLTTGAAIPQPGEHLRVDGVDGTILLVRPES